MKRLKGLDDFTRFWLWFVPALLLGMLAVAVLASWAGYELGNLFAGR